MIALTGKSWRTPTLEVDYYEGYARTDKPSLKLAIRPHKDDDKTIPVEFELEPRDARALFDYLRRCLDE